MKKSLVQKKCKIEDCIFANTCTGERPIEYIDASIGNIETAFFKKIQSLMVYTDEEFLINKNLCSLSWLTKEYERFFIKNNVGSEISNSVRDLSDFLFETAHSEKCHSSYIFISTMLELIPFSKVFRYIEEYGFLSEDLKNELIVSIRFISNRLKSF